MPCSAYSEKVAMEELTKSPQAFQALLFASKLSSALDLTVGTAWYSEK